MRGCPSTGVEGRAVRREGKQPDLQVITLPWACTHTHLLTQQPGQGRASLSLLPAWSLPFPGSDCFIHPFLIFCVPGIFLGFWDTAGNSFGKHPCPHGAVNIAQHIDSEEPSAKCISLDGGWGWWRGLGENASLSVLTLCNPMACQFPLSTEFSRQEYWSGLPFPSSGDLLDPGIKPGLLHCRQILYHLSPQGSPHLTGK